MSIAQQLYHLQELDTALASGNAELQRFQDHLKESAALVSIRSQQKDLSRKLDDIKQRKKSLEWEDQDLSAKINKASEDLYSGRIRNPKELASLQADIAMLKQRRGGIDDKLLGIMDSLEAADKELALLLVQLQAVEGQWQEEQKQLRVNIENSTKALTKLDEERRLMLSSLEPQIVALFEEIKKKRKTAVARVSQGTCTGCHIQLLYTDQQKARGGSLVKCSSCGRILYY